MGLFDFFKAPAIDQGVVEYSETNGAVLLDVRTREEYQDGHILGSINIPFQELAGIESAVQNKSTPIFSYCLSGARSAQASAELRCRGYVSVKNIGGINRYSGKIER